MSDEPKSDEPKRNGYQGFEMKWGDKSVRLPAILITVLMGFFGVGGAAGGVAGVSYVAAQPEEPERTEMERLLNDQISETVKLRKVVSSYLREQSLRKLEHAMMEDDINRSQARDMARDKLWGLEDRLKDFPLDGPIDLGPL